MRGMYWIACKSSQNLIQENRKILAIFSHSSVGRTQRAYSEIKDYFRRFDPNHKNEKEIFEKLGYIDIQNLAKRVKAKFVMITALMDDCCPPSTQFAVYNKITSDKNVIFYYDYEHEGLPGANETAIQFFLGKEIDDI